MERLKIAFVDFWPEWNIEDFITPILRKHFDVVFDKQNPDIVFHSIFNRMAETPKYKCKKVLILAENWRPDHFGAQYSISFDPTTDRNFQLPLWQIYLLLKPELKNRLYNRLNWKDEEIKKFCSFTVSNPSNFIRNGAYAQLSQYKTVSSYGRYMTNDLGLQKASEGRYWRDAKEEFFLKTPHKFMLAYENSPYRYYCTEKLMDAFLAGSMPIYHGDPRVGESFNTAAFINGTKINGIDEAIKMDKDPIYFRSVYEQPVFTPEQVEKLESNLFNFKGWLIDTVKK